MIILDTNILLRLAKPADPAHATTIGAIAALQTTGEELGIVPQSIYEFWAVATRPQAANGLGMTTPLCKKVVAAILSAFHFLDDRPMLYRQWEVLVDTYQCHGRVSFDARIVAAMQTYGLSRVLTYNVGDFLRFPGIVALDPNSVAAPP